MGNSNLINYIYTEIIYYKVLLVNIQWLRFLLVYKIIINFRDFCKIPLQMKWKILYYILSNENNVIFSTDISWFSKEFFSKANKITNFKKNKKKLKKLLTNNNIYYIINT